MNAPARVLVCDDELQILRALKMILRDAGFEPVVTATAEEALDAAALRPPLAAIVDLVLPDGSGIDVCRRLREWSEMPIPVLSAVGEEDQKVAPLEAGADDYLVKPFSPRGWSRGCAPSCGAPATAPRSRRSAPTGSRSTSPRASSAATARRSISRRSSTTSCARWCETAAG